MKNNPHNPSASKELNTTAAVTAALAVAPLANAADRGLINLTKSPKKLRIGLVGCGGRGTAAVHDCVQSSPNIEVYALGDMFPEKIAACRKNLKGLGDKVQVTDDRCFLGFDAHLKVIENVDIVLCTTPPGFRPQHLRAAVNAGKHAFIEKPVCVDPAGYHSILASAEIARKNNTGILAGTQYRHDVHYQEVIKRIHDGEIGEILTAQCYYCGGGAGGTSKSPSNKPEWSEMEFQIRNWYWFTWLSGDFIAEQHVHNLDVMNWVMGSHPISCLSIGGNQARKQGNIFDHFTTIFDYPNGIKVTSMCRQIEGGDGQLEDRIVGTRGVALAHGLWPPYPEIKDNSGNITWKWEGKVSSPYVQEHRDFITSIRAGHPLNEACQVADSSLTGVMARMSAYTGKVVTWEQAIRSKLDLFPKKLEFGPHPVEDFARPGKTPLI